MGRIWTVCGLARAAVCALLVLTSTSCSNANLGWNYFPGYGRLRGYFPPLRVTGPTFISAAASCSSAFKVGFSDSSGGFVSSTADVKLNLGGTGTPTFYSDAACTQVISGTTLATGELAKVFYVKNPNAGVQQVQTTHPDLPVASRNYQVDPAPPATIKLLRGPTTFSANTCVEYEVGFFDLGGNQVPFGQTGTLTFTLSGAGGQGIYDQSDSFCQAVAPTLVYSLFPGSWTQIIHIKSPNLSDTLTLAGSTATVILPAVTLNTLGAVAVPTEVRIAGISTQLQIGDCDQATAYPADAGGNPFTAAGATTITFSSPSANVQFFTDACITPGTTSVANPGFPAQIFVRGLAREKTKIIASAVGLTGAMVDVEFANLALQVVAGDEHTCAMFKAGKVECWGSNAHGQLGVAGTLGSQAVPVTNAVAVAGLPGAASLIAAGPNHTCAIVQVGGNGEVWCWGRNDHGQLGIPAGADTAVPVQAFVPVPVSQIVDVTTGRGHTCAIKLGGALWCWGNNTDGQLANAATFGLDSRPPTLVAGLTPGWVMASGDSTCSLDFSDDLYCWGSNAWGQLQLSPVTTPNSAIPILLNANARSIGLGPNQACMMDLAALDLSCWGRNLFGELGVSTGYGGSVPVTAPVNTGFRRQAPPAAIFGGEGFTCVVLYSGVLCFGKNDSGQLGNGSTVSSYEPTLLPIYVNSNYVPGFGAGKAHACAAQWDGRVVCWGLNDHAQLGLSPAATPSSANPVFLSL